MNDIKTLVALIWKHYTHDGGYTAWPQSALNIVMEIEQREKEREVDKGADARDGELDRLRAEVKRLRSYVTRKPCVHKGCMALVCEEPHHR